MGMLISRTKMGADNAHGRTNRREDKLRKKETGDIVAATNAKGR